MTEQKEWPTLGYSVKGNRFAIVADLCDIDENYKADQIIELVDRAALTARDARVAELEGLLRQCWPCINGATDELHDEIRKSLAGQRQQGEPEWPEEQCPVTGAIRDVDFADLGDQQQGERCQGENCGTTTGQHSRECIREAARDQGWIPTEEDFKGYAKPEQAVAVDERRDWSCYDTTFLLEHIRRDTNFDADLIGAMLKFSQTARPFCHRMTVVMPERTVARFPNSWASGWNACLDKLTCLNRNTVPLELLERIANKQDAAAFIGQEQIELRAILGAKP